MAKSIEDFKKDLRLKQGLKKGSITLADLFSQKSEGNIESKIDSHIKNAIEDIILDVAKDIVDGYLESKEFMQMVAYLVVQNMEPPKDGNDYILTDNDISKIARNIPSDRLPVIEKVIEKTQIVKEKPIVTKQIVEVSKPLDSKEVIDAINNAPLKSSYLIDGSHVKIGEKDKREGTQLGSIHRGGLKLIWNTQLDGLVNGSNTIFTVPASLPDPKDDKYIVSSRGTLKTVEGGDFTVSNSNRTITFTSAPPSGSDSPRIILYHGK